LEFGIKGPKAWNNPFEKNRKNPLSGEDAYKLDKINGLRERFIESIASLSGVKKTGGSVSEMCTAIMSMLEANALSEKLDSLIVSLTEKGEMETASRYDQLYEKVAALIGKISDLMGDDNLSLKDLTGLIDIGLKEIKIGIIPPTMDTLTAGDLQRTRFDKIRALFMIGTTAGVIPRIKSGSGILTERERNFLKKEDRELAPTAEEDLYIQRFYIYMMLHKPSEKLYITYPTSDTGGDPLKPSVILEDLDELAEGITQDQTVAEQGHNWNARGLRELSGELTGDKLNEALLNYFAVKKSPELEKILEGAFYTNKQDRLNADVTAKLFDGGLKGSVSRFETFSQCPYKYFLQYTLKIQPRPEYEVNNAEIGNIYHKTMELYSKKVKAQDTTFRTITEDESHRITEECLNQAIDDIQGQGGSLRDTSRSAFLVQNMHKVAKKTTDLIRSQLQAGSFTPAMFELTVSEEYEPGTQFRGVVDRVDISEDTDVYVRIVDYKTYGKTYKVEDVYNGLSLQLGAYLGVVIDKLKNDFKDDPERAGKAVKPAGVYYQTIGSRYNKNEKKLEASNELRGLTAIEALTRTDDAFSSATKSTVVDAAWDVNKNKGSNVASSDELENMVKFVQKKLIEIPREIKGGNVDLAPNEKSKPCEFCDFKDVCRFTPGEFGTTWKELPPVEKADMENAVFGRTQA
ncbi:MAG: PD-(D/E)XK nuclease family protein, partial [Parasporobacterium sp.]|nr:PD-(D/E)XK nuclease family protein [Parasporobacterium sp.]